MLNLTMRFVAVIVFVVSIGLNPAWTADKYEIWAIDQSNSPGLTYGGAVYIYDGHTLENGRNPAEATAERINLSGAAAAMCLAKTGANPVRPHMLAFNASQTHAIISFVASGHVLFIKAATRTPVDSFAHRSERAERDRSTSPYLLPTKPTSLSPTRTASCSSASTPITRQRTSS
jgi:hypothetical protein